LSIYLQFDFREMNQVFENPIKILTTNKLSEVKSIFDQVEDALNKGYYVAGYVSYEAAPAFDHAYQVHSNPTMPLVWFGVFEEATKKKEQLDKAYRVSDWKNTIKLDEYNDSIQHIKSKIQYGHTYQVNYTTRLTSTFNGDSYSYYNQLRQNQEAPYNAYLDIGNYHILSMSPELFFQVKNGLIKTKPMKGTMKRGKTTQEDLLLKKALKSSEKNRAENVMIVDLLRNDLGRIAQPGSVHVPKLFDIEQYPTVHQMTSTIEAKLDTSLTVWNWFEALFPCGSITGAPKVETMKIISEVEKTPREVYCGAIGWISPSREAIFNVPIRTLSIDTHTSHLSFGTGSGITWHSSNNEEYEEWIQKTAFLTENRNEFDLLETILLKDGGYPLLSYHLTRLNDSASYFNYPCSCKHVKENLSHILKDYPDGDYKVRLLLNRNGELSITTSRIDIPLTEIYTRIATEPISKNNIFLYHKTTNRAIYEKNDANAPASNFSTLLWNEEGYITEFTFGNVVFKKGELYYTPPISAGLLGGTMRSKLLDDGVLIEKNIHKDTIDTFDEIWFINGVRGWVKVCMI
jgi:para-aminobenzoate synthetase / 4-amino-4-deoxychorismate lyase